MRLAKPVRFEPGRHDVSAFDCGSEAQTRWLRQVASTAQAARTAVVYVVTPEAEDRVLGYYALAAASVGHADAPPPLLKSAGRRPIPVILLARLRVGLGAQGVGLGAALVKDAMLRAHRAAGIIGARALLIHAESATARDFYVRLAEFEPSPTDPLHLVLLMADIESIVGKQTASTIATDSASPRRGGMAGWHEGGQFARVRRRVRVGGADPADARGTRYRRSTFSVTRASS